MLIFKKIPRPRRDDIYDSLGEIPGRIAFWRMKVKLHVLERTNPEYAPRLKPEIGVMFPWNRNPP